MIPSDKVLQLREQALAYAIRLNPIKHEDLLQAATAIEAWLLDCERNAL
jgi:hypothetical protein